MITASAPYTGNYLLQAWSRTTLRQPYDASSPAFGPEERIAAYFLSIAECFLSIAAYFGIASSLAYVLWPYNYAYTYS